jgi:hypothetical protein
LNSGDLYIRSGQSGRRHRIAGFAQALEVKLHAFLHSVESVLEESRRLLAEEAAET